MSYTASLTTHDLSILQKIADPEAGPSAPLLLSTSLPKDPHYPDPTIYAEIVHLERTLIANIKETELQLAGLRPSTNPSANPQEIALKIYQDAISELNSLITTYPNYASFRNNCAQALRRVYGDALLTKTTTSSSLSENRMMNEPTPLYPVPSDPDLLAAGSQILTDLSSAISLLYPRTPYSPLSPTSANTLAAAYTQRGALYHLTAKNYSQNGALLRIDASRKEASWSVVDFEEAASRDFMMGGRLGNEVAKQMAVVANPTAKLCGDMVREAMRKEYAAERGSE